VFKVIRTDGSEEVFEIAPTMELIKSAIGAETLRNVGIGQFNPVPQAIVMIADEFGSGWKAVLHTPHCRRVGSTKAINQKAQEVYWRSVRNPQEGSFSPGYIWGDVAILHPDDVEDWPEYRGSRGPRASITADEFESQYAERSRISVEQLRASGRVFRPCQCGEEDCEGWRSTTLQREANDAADSLKQPNG
jgi:hypothetical protein